MEGIYQAYYDLINNYQAIAAAIIGVLSAILVGLFQYITTVIIKNREKKYFENAVVSAIYEELTGLYNCYDNVFQKAVLNVPDDDYMTTIFTITQDFFTIYHSNASNIGKIKKEEIRNSIVQIYILLKKLIENIIYYKDCYNLFMERRIELISRIQCHVNPKSYAGLFISDKAIIEELCPIFGMSSPVNEKYENVIPIIINHLEKTSIDPLKLYVFIAGDNGARIGLIKQTNDLKKDYTDIREKIINLMTIIKKEYNIISDTIIDKETTENISPTHQNKVSKKIESITS